MCTFHSPLYLLQVCWYCPFLLSTAGLTSISERCFIFYFLLFLLTASLIDLLYCFFIFLWFGLGFDRLYEPVHICNISMSSIFLLFFKSWVSIWHLGWRSKLLWYHSSDYSFPSAHPYLFIGSMLIYEWMMQLIKDYQSWWCLVK